MPISIPYEGTTLPGYLFLVDDSGTARPTVIYNNGYDSTLEEAYFAVGAAARAAATTSSLSTGQDRERL